MRLVVALLVLAACEGPPAEATDDRCGITADAYIEGMSRDGDTFTFTLTEASPAPPDRGDNSLSVAVSNAVGEPVIGASLGFAAFMPEHGHGSTPASVPATETSDGTYVTDTLDLFMPGVWDLTVSVEGDEADEVTWRFCIEG